MIFKSLLPLFILLFSINSFAIFKLKTNQECSAQGKIIYLKSKQKYFFAFNIGTNSEMRTQINSYETKKLDKLKNRKVEASFKIKKDSFGIYFESNILNIQKLKPYAKLKIYHKSENLCRDLMTKS